MSVTGIRHTGLVVTDLERSLALYRDALGFTPWRRAVETGPFIEQVTGIPGVELEWVKLKAPDQTMLELLCYRRPPSSPSSTGAPGAPHQAVNTPGRLHAAFTVSDVDALFERLPRHGVRCPAPPALSPDGKAKVMYCFDPDGINLELVQEMD